MHHSILEGWLFKKKESGSSTGKLLFGDQNKRWFRIQKIKGPDEQELALCYFRFQGDIEAKGWMFLKDITDICEYGEYFRLVSVARTLNLEAQTRAEHRLWVQSILELCPMANVELTPALSHLKNKFIGRKAEAIPPPKDRPVIRNERKPVDDGYDGNNNNRNRRGSHQDRGGGGGGGRGDIRGERSRDYYGEGGERDNGNGNGGRRTPGSRTSDEDFTEDSSRRGGGGVPLRKGRSSNMSEDSPRRRDQDRDRDRDREYEREESSRAGAGGRRRDAEQRYDAPGTTARLHSHIQKGISEDADYDDDDRRRRQMSSRRLPDDDNDDDRGGGGGGGRRTGGGRDRQQQQRVNSRDEDEERSRNNRRDVMRDNAGRDNNKGRGGGGGGRDGGGETQQSQQQRRQRSGRRDDDEEDEGVRNNISDADDEDKDHDGDGDRDGDGESKGHSQRFHRRESDGMPEGALMQLSEEKVARKAVKSVGDAELDRLVSRPSLITKAQLTLSESDEEDEEDPIDFKAEKSRFTKQDSSNSDAADATAKPSRPPRAPASAAPSTQPRPPKTKPSAGVTTDRDFAERDWDEDDDKDRERDRSQESNGQEGGRKVSQELVGSKGGVRPDQGWLEDNFDEDN
eukprot:gene2307-4491_t